MDKIQLSDHFTYKRLLRFVFPSITMMVFTSIYSVVDGLFVSNFVGKSPFTAINLIFPFFALLGAFGFMFGTGGSAVVGITLGMGEPKKANRYFSMIVYVTVIWGLCLAIFGYSLMEHIAVFLGAEGDVLQYCIVYGRILIWAIPMFMLGNVFQSFFVTSQKPKLGLVVMVVGGVLNIVLDAVFIAGLGFGVQGAAMATAIGQISTGVLPLFYFCRKNDSLLRLGKTKFYPAVLLKTCVNGSSEMVGNLAYSLIYTVYNWQVLKYTGEDGVAVYGVLQYMGFVFNAIFFGYAVGVSPIFSFHYGAGHKDEIQSLFRKSLRVVLSCGVVMFLLSQILAGPLAKLFVGYDETLRAMTVHAMHIYGCVFLFNGFCVLGSSFFTALGNGKASALISFLRTFVFEVISVLVLPLFFGLNGIWSAAIVAEAVAVMVTIILLKSTEKSYFPAIEK